MDHRQAERAATTAPTVSIDPTPSEPTRSAASLWVKQPESQAHDRTILAARLCGCSDVCQAPIEDY